MNSAPEFFNFAGDVFDHWAAAQPQANALWWVSHDGDEERQFTYASLSELSLRAACAFARSGIGEGDLVMVLLPRIPEWWIVMLGLIRCGAVPVTCTTQLTADDLAYRLDAGPIGRCGDGDGAVGAQREPVDRELRTAREHHRDGRYGGRPERAAPQVNRSGSGHRLDTCCTCSRCRSR